MDELPNKDADEHRETKSSWRSVARIILLIYLVTLPACTKNAGHFGPGFFPLLAALLLVPVGAVLASIEAVSAWTEVPAHKATVWVAMGMSAVAVGYWAVIVLAIAERSGS